MGTMYGAYIVNYRLDLILENLHPFMYFYLIFLPNCFITIATDFAQNPGLMQFTESRPGPPFTWHSKNIMM